MAILNGIVTVLLVITALILIVTVLLQPGESNGLGAIAGGAETFFGILFFTNINFYQFRRNII